MCLRGTLIRIRRIEKGFLARWLKLSALHSVLFLSLLTRHRSS